MKFPMASAAGSRAPSLCVSAVPPQLPGSVPGMAAKFSEQHLFKPTQNSNAISPCVLLMGGECDLRVMLSGLGCFWSGKAQGFRWLGMKYAYALFPEFKKKKEKKKAS